MKKEIDNAIATLSFFSSSEWGLYVYCLTPAKEKKELKHVAKARKILGRYGISEAAVELHSAREMNFIPEPERFIDRYNKFVAIETSDLPF